MKWPWQHQEQPDARLTEAERRLRELRERADRVMPDLERRKRENHWTETILTVVRGGSTHE